MKNRNEDNKKAGLDKKTIDKLQTDVNIFGFLSYRDFLQAIYQHLKTTKKRYSYNKFSEDLGLSNCNVAWMIITGRRKLTANNLQKVVPALRLKGKPRQYFTTLVKHNNSNRPDQREKYFQHLIDLRAEDPTASTHLNNLEYFAKWYYPIIREMAGLDHFQSDPDWIAQNLMMKVLPKQAEKSLELLEKLELIQYDDEAKRHSRTKEQIFPDRVVGPMASTRFHEKMCELAKESVTRVPPEERELNVLTVCLSQEEAQKAAALLYEAAEKIFKLEQKSEDAERVYQVNLQLFPVTKKEPQ